MRDGYSRFGRWAAAFVSGVAVPFFAPGPSALAQEPERLDELVVTATRLATPLSRVAASFSTVDAEEIERRQLRTLSDALATVPGFSLVQSGGAGTTTSVFVRGTNSSHVLFLLNGRRIGDPGGTRGLFDPANLLLWNVERIEILRGPRSVLYGSDAIGAVVNIITKRGGGALKAEAAAEAGSFRTLDVRAGISGSVEGVDFRFDAERFATGGTTIAPEASGNAENDSFSNRTASAALGFAPAPHLALDLFAQYTRAALEIDEFFRDDPNKEDLRTIRLLQLDATGSFFDRFWTATFDAAVNDQDFDNLDPPDAPGGARSASYFDGRIIEAGIKNDLAVHEGGTATLGWESRSERGKTSGDAFFAFEKSTATHSGYAQYQFDLFDRVSGTLGVRIDDNEDFGSETTYGVSAAYRHPETGTKLWSGIGTGFRAPSLVDLFGGVSGLFVGNPNLKPETSRGWEAGIVQEWFDGRVRTGATYFQNDIDDLIEGFVFKPELGLFTAENVNEARTYGVESFVSLEPLESLVLTLEHTYTRAEDRRTGEDLLRRPKHRGDLSATWWAMDELSLDLDVLVVGDRTDLGGVRQGGYYVANLAASYAFDDSLRLFGRIANLFDRRYEDPMGFEHPGLGAFAGVAVTY